MKGIRAKRDKRRNVILLKLKITLKLVKKHLRRLISDKEKTNSMSNN